MRVGLVIYGSLDTLSGGYLYDRKLVEQLVLAGHVVDVLSLSYYDYAKHLGDNFNRAWQQRLAHAPVDLLLQDELNHPSLLRANLRRSRTGNHSPRPVVTIVHHLRSSEAEHPALLRRLYRTVERLYLNSVDAVLCNSRTTQAAVTQLLHRPKPCHVAYPAADHLPDAGSPLDAAALAGRARTPGPLRLLFVGNLIPRKGLHIVLDALRRTPAGFWQLDVVGQTDVDDDYAKKMMAHSRTFAPGAVRFLGRLPDAELVRTYRSHHALLAPSYEGFGIACLEAMRFGLPVLASTTGAAHELVTPGENGVLVAPRDPQTIADWIYYWFTNRELLTTMSYAARRRYERHPTWQQSMAGAVAWLTSLPAAMRQAPTGTHP